MVISPKDANKSINQKLREEQQRALQQKQEEIKRQKEELRLQRQQRKEAILKAIDADDLKTVQEYIQAEGNIHFIFERDRNGDLKYAVHNQVHSPEMLTLILDNISPIHPDRERFTGKTLHRAIMEDNANVPEFIEIARQHKITLNLSLKGVEDVKKLEELVKAGADIQSFDFHKLYTNYDEFKNGYWIYGRYDDVWIKPDLQKAAGIREKLLPLVSRAAELGYKFETTENGAKPYEYSFLAEMAKERAGGQTFVAPLNGDIDIVDAAEQEKERVRLALEAEKERQRLAQEAKKRAEQQQRERNEMLRNAIYDDNLKTAADLLAQGAELNIELNKYKTNELDYQSERLASYVKSATMAEFVLSTLDLSKKEHRIFAEEMFVSAINKDDAPVDTLIFLAQKNGVSLKPAMAYAASHTQTALNVFEKLSLAGVDRQAYDFETTAQEYYWQKDGYWTGRDGDIWHDRDAQKAAELKNMLNKILEQGYVADKTKRCSAEFMQELDWEHKYTAFPAEDKELITDLQNNNIDAVRKKIGTGLLKNDIVDYMTYVPMQKGTFIEHYKKMLNRYEGNHNKPATSLDEAEKDFIQKAELYELAKISRFKPTGLSEIIGEKFVEGCIDITSDYWRQRHKRAVTNFKLLTPEHQTEVAKKTAEKLSPLLQKYYRKHADLAEMLIKMYEISDGESKDILRLALLKFRTSGTNTERRDKADFIKDILSNEKVQKDETLHAIAQVSRSPVSKLNLQLKKYAQDLEK